MRGSDFFFIILGIYVIYRLHNFSLSGLWPFSVTAGAPKIEDNPDLPFTPDAKTREMGTWPKGKIDALLSQIFWQYARGLGISIDEFNNFSPDIENNESLARALDGSYTFQTPDPLIDFAKNDLKFSTDLLETLKKLADKGYAPGVIPFRIKQNPLGLPSLIVETPKEFWELDMLNYAISEKEIRELLNNLKMVGLPLQVIPDGSSLVSASIPQIKTILDSVGIQYTIADNGSNTGLGE